MKKILLLFTFAILSFSCNEEKSREQIEFEYAEKTKKLHELNVTLNRSIKSLENAKSELNKTTGFKILRSQSERDAQIRNAESNIKKWEENITEIKREIEFTENLYK